MIRENYTIGIEEEYMICDPVSGDMVDRADKIMPILPRKLSERFSYELLLSEIESNTSICDTVTEAIQKLAANRKTLSDIGEKLNYKIGISGTHPTAKPKKQNFVNNESYNWVSQNLRSYARQNITFALHVHVGFNDNEEMIHVCNGLRRWIAPLLSLSANSPFFNSNYTGFKSSRTIQFGIFPRTGIPQEYKSYRSFEDVVSKLEINKSIAKPRHLWWKIRPHMDFGTIEFRMFDIQRGFNNTFMLASLAQSLCYVALNEYKRGSLIEKFNIEYLNDSLWKASRFGFDSIVYDEATNSHVKMKDLILIMLDYAKPGIKYFNNNHIVEAVDDILLNGTEGDRQYFYYKENNDNFDKLKHYLIDGVEY